MSGPGWGYRIADGQIKSFQHEGKRRLEAALSIDVTLDERAGDEVRLTRHENGRSVTCPLSCPVSLTSSPRRPAAVDGPPVRRALVASSRASAPIFLFKALKVV
jgi:hypothetical protein